MIFQHDCEQYRPNYLQPVGPTAFVVNCDFPGYESMTLRGLWGALCLGQVEDRLEARLIPYNHPDVKVFLLCRAEAPCLDQRICS